TPRTPTLPGTSIRMPGTLTARDGMAHRRVATLAAAPTASAARHAPTGPPTAVATRCPRADTSISSGTSRRGATSRTANATGSHAGTSQPPGSGLPASGAGTNDIANAPRARPEASCADVDRTASRRADPEDQLPDAISARAVVMDR